MITTKDSIYLFIFLLSLMLFNFHVQPNAVAADDRNGDDSHLKAYENSGVHSDFNDLKRLRARNNKGNELTGLTAAWLLAAANLTVVLSLLMKGLIRFFSLKSETIRALKRLNQSQKQLLMRFHYLLNPLALSIAILHFLLSSCRTTSLPEWGLFAATAMVFLGLLLTYKGTPKRIRGIVYRLHTGPMPLFTMIILLFFGHLIAG